jgi:hypothetical protein
MADDVIIHNEPERTLERPPARPIRMTEVVRRLSWTAVWAGVLITLGMELLMLLFGMAVGLKFYNWSSPNPWGGVTSWSIVWYLVSMGWSFFFGAWCAARLSGSPAKGVGILHGLTTWGLATVASVTGTFLVLWAVARAGINLVATAAIATAQAAPAVVNRAPQTQVNQAAQQADQFVNQLQQSAGPISQAAIGSLDHLFWLLWAGVTLAFITAIIGGSVGRLFEEAVEVPVASSPTRRAA